MSKINLTIQNRVVKITEVVRSVIVQKVERKVSIGTIGLRGPQGVQGPQGIQGIQGPPGEGSSINLDTGWTISPGYNTRKTFDPNNYTQQQLVDLICTLIDLLKTSTLPGT